MADGYSCEACKKRTHISQLVCAFSYDQLLAQTIVKGLKYEFLEELAFWMGAQMALAWRLHGRNTPDTLAVPIPLHPRRFRERGFNQAELLGARVAEQCDISFSSSLLKRARSTKKQTELSEQGRFANMRGAFSVISVPHCANRDILLIDDVCTSGATLQEAARILREAGARDVRALVFARNSN